MSFFNAYQLLGTVAREYQHGRETFSTAEIVSRINEIKYLSSRKKVPKLSLRKEILHLESKVQTVLELEQRMLKQKHRQSAHEKELKRRIAEMQRRLAAAQDQDLQKKLDRIAMLFGDYAAKKKTEEEVQAAIAELRPGKWIISGKKPVKGAARAETQTYAPEISPPQDLDVRKKAEMLRQRIGMLKGEWELLKILKKEKSIPGTEEKIALLERKLDALLPAPDGQKTSPDESRNAPEPVVEQKEVKHTLLFAPSPAKKTEDENQDLDLESELPLPPPPKMKRK